MTSHYWEERRKKEEKMKYKFDKRCKKCGKRNASNIKLKVCWNCGAKLK